jgi:predicted lipid carrier protein YhbT/chorismate mutase
MRPRYWFASTAGKTRLSRWRQRLALAGVRDVIDRVDDGLLLLVAARRRLVRVVVPLKRGAGVPPRDPPREREVRLRAQRLAQRLDVPDATAEQLLDVLIGDACRQQGLPTDLDQGAAGTGTGMMAPIMTILTPSVSAAPHRWLRLLPPPRRLAPLLRVFPSRWQTQLLEAAMARVLAAPLQSGALDFMHQRRLGIEVADLGLRWVFELRDERLCTSDEPAEATVRGSATDLLLLASRLEDADTLFFQRRLVLTGDTELGLTARNLLDRLPWESIPLGLRIALNRGARFARAARAAHCGES